MSEFHDIEQNSDEWFTLRSGKLTSSNLGTIMANYGKAFGEPAKKLAVKIAVEQINGTHIESDYTNGHMDRGHEEEPIARMLYENETFSTVTNGGFYDAGFEGGSPDGLVGEDGLIEIKSAIPSMHFARVKRQLIDPSYKWQCIGNLRLSRRDWIDFVSYCADFPEDRRLYIFRTLRESVQEEFKMLDLRVEEFKALVKATRFIIDDSKYRL